MKKLFLIATVCIAASCTMLSAQSEQDTLLVLADQAFAQLHDHYVTLPDGTTERIARSDQDLPSNWPEGELKGLVLPQYIEEALLSVTIEQLEEGMWIVFRNEPEDIDTAIYMELDGYGQVAILAKEAGHANMEFMLLSSAYDPFGSGQDACDSQDDNMKCNGTGGKDENGNHETANCGSKGVWDKSSDTTEDGKPIYENLQTGQKGVGCGGGSTTMILSPY